jgi:large repetitive protein
MRRIARCTSILIALFTFAINCPLSTGQTVAIPHTDRGQYSNTGFHNPTNPNYVVGGDSFVAVYHNFFVFNLAGVVQPIASAKLALYVPSELSGPGYSSSDPSENYELHDVTTSIATLVAGTGGVAAHTDLGSGVVYGSRTMTAADMGTVVEITLNPAAIAALDSATGLIGIGGSLTTLDGVANSEFTFGSSGSVTDTTELRLTLVPEPSALWLLGIGAIRILGTRRKTTQRY